MKSTGVHIYSITLIYLKAFADKQHRVYLLTLFMCLFMQKIYVRYKNVIEHTTNKKISILKLSMYVSNNMKETIAIPDKLLKEIITLHCCYDKRSDRINMTDLYQQYKN